MNGENVPITVCEARSDTHAPGRRAFVYGIRDSDTLPDLPPRSQTAMIGDKNTTVGAKSGLPVTAPLAPYSLINPPPTLETPLSVDIPLLPPGELERLSVEHSHTRNAELRDRLVMYHQRLVRSLAGRFSGTGELLEDLIQVGNIGLINALDRFDARQGTRFSTYATPTILGEIKRYFRDKSATIKVPRWLQELSHHVRREAYVLQQETGRAPTPTEIAERMEMSEGDIRMALESGEVSNPLSLDSQMDMATDTASLFDLVGRADAGLSEFETFGDLRSAMATLLPREREVISLRFFEEMSQAKIAKQLNISQMHVSRLQQRALRRLRELLSDDDDTRRVSRRVPVTPH